MALFLTQISVVLGKRQRFREEPGACLHWCHDVPKKYIAAAIRRLESTDSIFELVFSAWMRQDESGEIGFAAPEPRALFHVEGNVPSLPAAVSLY